MPSNAFESFKSAMDYVEQLIDIHSQVQSGKGRRHRKEAIHRAGVVLIVAGWQAFVEKLGYEALDLIGKKLDEPNIPTWIKASFNFRKGAINKTIGDLNTPNSQNVQRLFLWSFGFDPKPHWNYNVAQRKWDSNFYCSRTDEWLRIRHAIAHGNDLPANLPWLKNGAGTPRLNLTLLRECERHFTRLSELTDKAMGKFLLSDYDTVTDWYNE